MMTMDLAESLNDERMAAFLPLIASVWEDGDPTDIEIAAENAFRFGEGCRPTTAVIRSWQTVVKTVS